MAFILIGVTVCLVSKLINNNLSVNLKPEMDEFYVYSGVHPELYKTYLKYKNEGNMKKAQNALEELALYTDIEFRDQFHQKILKKQSSLSI
jgi:hypothetical protein